MDHEFLQQFNKSFARLSGEPVILYGLGPLTKFLAENAGLIPFKIVALLDRDLTSGSMYGFDIISIEQIEQYSRNIVIAAQLSNCRMIYKRISYLEKNGVSIFYPNGNQPKGATDSSLLSTEDLEKSKDLLFAAMDKHDIISFDIFDTALMRKCLLPDAVSTILNEQPNLPSEQSAMMETKFALEKELLIPRADILDAFNYAKSKGKKIIFASDMYYSKKQLSDVLLHNGYNGYSDIFVSSELKKSKESGELWEYLSTLYRPEQVLHIGDHQLCDCLIPEKFGFTTFYIKSSLELMQATGFDDVISAASTPADYFALGLVADKLFNSPFALHGTHGKLRIDSGFLFGYTFFGSLTSSFVRWILDSACENKEESLLFFGRDGYIWSKVYDVITDSLGLTAPVNKYFYTSRRAVSGASAIDENGIALVLQLYMNGNLTIQKMILNFFGVEVPLDHINKVKCNQMNARDILDYVLDNHKDAIISNARMELENFKAYLKRERIPESFGATDFVISGRTQQLLEKILGHSFHTYCYTKTTSKEASASNGDSNYFQYCTDSSSPYTTKDSLGASHVFGEAVYTAPHGQVLCFDKNGGPVFETLEYDVSQIANIHSGILAFAKDMLTHVDAAPSRQFSDLLYAKIFSNSIAITEKVTDSLMCIDSFNDVKERLTI